MRMILWLAVLAAIAVPGAADADPGVSMSPSQNSLFEVSLPAGTPEALAAGAALEPATFALAARRGPYVLHRPRIYAPSPRRSHVPAMPFAGQLHFGFLNPISNFSTGFNGGFRIGPQVNPNIQIGMGLDWWHRSENTVLELGEVHVPGSIADEQLILSESTSNLIPILFFVQVSGDKRMPVLPYAGFGAGYEWLSLSAHDFATHESFDEVFGGFGWQVWAGAGLQLDRHTRLNAEVYFNACEVGSEVDAYLDDYGPVTVRDAIDMNGVGMRFGASWQF